MDQIVQQLLAMASMEGHGVYVWASYALGFAVYTGVVVWSLSAYRRARNRSTALKQATITRTPS